MKGGKFMGKNERKVWIAIVALVSLFWFMSINRQHNIINTTVRDAYSELYVAGYEEAINDMQEKYGRKELYVLQEDDYFYPIEFYMSTDEANIDRAGDRFIRDFP